MTSKRSNKYARRSKKQNHSTKRELILKEGDGTQEYAQVVKMLGNGRLEAFCFDGKTRLCNIRGKLKKKVWIRKDDIILLSLRAFQDSKADVIHKFNDEEVQQLREKGHLPTTQLKNDHFDEEDEEDCPFNFL